MKDRVFSCWEVGAERAGLHSNCSELKETVMAVFCIFVITRRGCRNTFNITQHKARLIGLTKKVASAKHIAMTPVCKWATSPSQEVFFLLFHFIFYFCPVRVVSRVGMEHSCENVLEQIRKQRAHCFYLLWLLVNSNHVVCGFLSDQDTTEVKTKDFQPN